MASGQTVIASVFRFEPDPWRWTVTADGADDRGAESSEVDAWLAASVAVRAVIARRVEALR